MSKQIKSKKTGRVSILTEEEYALMLAEGTIIKRFDVTDLKSRPIIPSIKEVPKEIKVIKKVQK